MDWSIFHAVNRLAQRTSWAHGFFKVYANYGIVVFALMLAYCGIVSLRRGDALMLTRSVWAAGGACIALAVNQPIADWIGSVRPFAAHPHILTLVDRSTDPGFMSDHSIVAGGVAVGLCFVVRRVGIAALALAVLMALTRVYVGAHFPSDVVGGLVFGGGVVAAALPLVTRFVTPLSAKLLATSTAQKIAATPHP